MQTRCPRCGRSILWHYVRSTRAGVRAFCGLGVPHVDELVDSAADVWDALHIIRGDDDDDAEQLTLV